jgi:hypothetical protein
MGLEPFRSRRIFDKFVQVNEKKQIIKELDWGFLLLKLFRPFDSDITSKFCWEKN